MIAVASRRDGGTLVHASTIPFLRVPSPCTRRVDGLGWTVGLACDLYGIHVGLRSDSAAFLAALTDYLPVGWTTAAPDVSVLFSFKSEGRRHPLLFVDGARVQGRFAIGELVEFFAARLRLLIAERSTTHAFVHAGVVALNGRALVLPGRSGAGKSTLVRALVDGGATYYADDWAVIDRCGAVSPYMTMAEHVARSRPGGMRALPVGVVAFTRYAPGHAWTARRLGRGAAALALGRHAPGMVREPTLVWSALTTVAARATAMRVVRGEANAAAEVLLRIVAAH